MAKTQSTPAEKQAPAAPRRTARQVRFWALVLFVIVGLPALGLWLTSRSLGGSALADASDPGTLAAGRKLYDTHCAACHGKELEGEPNWRERKPSGRLPAPPHDDSGHTWHHPDAFLFAVTKHGLVPGKYAPPGYASDMPAYGETLTDGEIWAVLAYIASRWSPQQRLHQAATNRPRRR